MISYRVYGQGGKSLPLPKPCSPTSGTFISWLPPSSILLPSPVNNKTQNTALSFSCIILRLQKVKKHFEFLFLKVFQCLTNDSHLLRTPTSHPFLLFSCLLPPAASPLLLTLTSVISAVNEWDLKLNAWRDITYLHVPMYYPLYIHEPMHGLLINRSVILENKPLLKKYWWLHWYHVWPLSWWKQLRIFLKNLRQSSKIWAKCLEMPEWPSDDFWRIFRNLHKNLMVCDLQKIIKNIVSMINKVIHACL